MVYDYVDTSLDDNLVSVVRVLLLVLRLLNVLVRFQICCICRLDHHCIETLPSED